MVLTDVACVFRKLVEAFLTLSSSIVLIFNESVDLPFGTNDDGFAK